MTLGQFSVDIGIGFSVEGLGVSTLNSNLLVYHDKDCGLDQVPITIQYQNTSQSQCYLTSLSIATQYCYIEYYYYFRALKFNPTMSRPHHHLNK